MCTWYLRNTVLVAAIALMLGACATPYQQRGATTGATIGGISGAILDMRNPWRGGIIGAALGAIAGATIADISVQGAREAAYAGRPVEYRMESGRGYYYAEPLGYEDGRRCRRVREKVYEDGRLVRKRIIVICEGEKYERPNYRYDRHHDRYERDDND